MKINSLTSFLTVAGAASSFLLQARDAAAQTTVATAPVGYLQASCLSNSDTLVAPPFTRPAAFTAAVSSISSNVITLSSTSLTADAYDAPATTPPTKDTYYLTIGPATATLVGTVSVTAGSTTVTGTSTTFGTDVKAGDRITINDGVNVLTYGVAAIASSTSLTIDRAFSDTAATGNTSAVTNNATAAKTVSKTTTVKVTGRAATAAVITNSSSTLSGLAATYDHSPYEGRFYQVTSNATGSVTVNLNGDALTSVAAGTQVSIIPYLTLNSIFPATDVGVSYVATTSTRQTNTQVMIPNYSASGINLAPSVTYIYYSGGTGNVGWRDINNLSVDVGYVPLQPDGYFTYRNPTTSNLPLTFSGGVPVNRLVTTLASLSNGPADNPVALNRPADTTLNALGLGPSDGSFTATVSTRTTGDELFVYNSAVASLNKSPSVIYLYYNGGWRNINDLSTDRGTDIVSAGSALMVRKAATATAQSSFWSNSPNY